MTQTKRDTLVLQVWGLSVGVTTPRRKRTYVEKTSRMLQMGLIDDDLATRKMEDKC
jgi:hypothetical protein